MRSLSLGRAALLIAALGATSHRANAQTLTACQSNDVCRRSLEQAERSFADHLYAAARSSYQSAYDTVAVPSLLLRVGRCEQLLGRTQEARTIYRQLRNTQPPLDPESTTQLTAYSAELDAARAPRIEPDLAPKPHHEDAPKPLHKTWWFWTATGLAVGGVITGLAVGLAPRAPRDVIWAP